MYSRARFQLLVAFTAGTPRSHLRGTFQSRRNDSGKSWITALFREFLLAGGCSSAYINSAGVIPSGNSLIHAYMYEWNVQSPCHIGHSAGSAESTYGVSKIHLRLGEKITFRTGRQRWNLFRDRTLSSLKSPGKTLVHSIAICSNRNRLAACTLTSREVFCCGTVDP